MQKKKKENLREMTKIQEGISSSKPLLSGYEKNTGQKAERNLSKVKEIPCPHFAI
jgi:hypothetical protein